jgi:hypothetical protein
VKDAAAPTPLPEPETPVVLPATKEEMTGPPDRVMRLTLLPSNSVICAKLPSDEKARAAGPANWIAVPSPSAYPLDKVPAILVTEALEMTTFLTVCWLYSATRAYVSSGEIFIPRGPVNEALVPESSVEPDELPPARTLVARDARFNL